eukprot:CAMPEP_0196767908 /NCGR_PEP_ID=MMETSP1095-20130614/42108_1 /TAXON_ID=96789 ORGANISM="Chromulina nebulosa, Strain UTEXLB2642" /NCGR_SAMPLE_ID=MMETSP1095 /ASSEMBLY_ACC=CAM_ASM_000446 /LENGTH=557 /DNA_ID=CAMNT_0042136735 /DNA_START=384 /DNA_END=2054 /DNA_ORIENTATION=+
MIFVESNVDNSNIDNNDATIIPTIIQPMSDKIRLSDEEFKPNGWLNKIQRDAFAPQLNVPNVTYDNSKTHDNISERSSSPEFQAKWLPQYGSEDDLEDDVMPLEEPNLNNSQYVDEDDYNQNDQYSNSFNNNQSSYKSIDGIENSSSNHHNEAVIDSVLLDDLLHRQSNDNYDYSSNYNIDMNNRDNINSNSYINNNNINYDSSSDNYNPKYSSKFKFIEDDIDDINDYWNDYDITDELNKSDKSMISNPKKSTNLIDLNSNSFYGHKSLTAWSKSINTQSISKINSNNNSYINNDRNDYELYEYKNSSTIGNNDIIFKINNCYNNVDESIFDDHVNNVTTSNDYSITNDIESTSDNNILDNMLDLYNQSMSKSLDLSHNNNLLSEKYSINANKRKDYERFDSIDGVHNALQITIDNKITIRKAGQVVKESNEFIQDQLDVSFSTHQSNQEIALEKVNSFDSNELVMIDEEDYKMTDPSTEILNSNDNITVEEDTTGNGTWFQDMKTVKIEDFYIPTTSTFVDPDDVLPDTESKLPVITYLKLNMSIRLKLFSGLDW